MKIVVSLILFLGLSACASTPTEQSVAVSSANVASDSFRDEVCAKVHEAAADTVNLIKIQTGQDIASDVIACYQYGPNRGYGYVKVTGSDLDMDMVVVLEKQRSGKWQSAGAPVAIVDHHSGEIILNLGKMGQGPAGNSAPRSHDL